MAHSKNLLLRDVLCKIVFILNIVHIYEFVGFCFGRNTGSGAARRPSLGGLGGGGTILAKEIITLFIYFKIVSFTTSAILFYF